MVAELDVVVVEPAAGDGGCAIQVGNVVAVIVLLVTDLVKREGGGAYAANKPVRRLPTIPPMPCTAKISRASSTRRRYLSFVA